MTNESVKLVQAEVEWRTRVNLYRVQGVTEVKDCNGAGRAASVSAQGLKGQNETKIQPEKDEDQGEVYREGGRNGSDVLADEGVKDARG